MLITPEQLIKICPILTPARAAEVAAVLNENYAAFKFTPASFKMFLAQVIHESSANGIPFSNRVESLFYTTPERICAVWPTRFNMLGSGGKLNANFYIKNPEKLANTVYANRNGNGNFASGDGYRYRGRSWIQTTGKEAYKELGDYLKIDLISNPDLLLTDDIACKAACWEYCISKHLLSITDFKTVTRAINGGLVGYEERLNIYNKVLEVIK